MKADGVEYVERSAFLSRIISYDEQIDKLQKKNALLTEWKEKMKKLIKDVIYDLEFESNRNCFYDKAHELLKEK